MANLAWSQAQVTEFIRVTTSALENVKLTAQNRALLEADRDGAGAYLRYLEAVEGVKAAGP